MYFLYFKRIDMERIIRQSIVEQLANVSVMNQLILFMDDDGGLIMSTSSQQYPSLYKEAIWLTDEDYQKECKDTLVRLYEDFLQQ